MKKVKLYIFAVITCAMLILAGCSDKAVTLSEITEGDPNVTDEPLSEAVKEIAEDAPEATADIPEEPALIVVYICGAVENPGVYELSEGSRICDGLDAAGGFSENADEGRINLAGYLKDGDMVFFPEVGEEIPEGAAGVSESTSSGGLVNINTASAEQLCTLPGIGASKASAIVKYREENGAFTAADQIMNVTGIGESLYNNIKDLISI